MRGSLSSEWGTPATPPLERASASTAHVDDGVFPARRIPVPDRRGLPAGKRAAQGERPILSNQILVQVHERSTFPDYGWVPFRSHGAEVSPNSGRCRAAHRSTTGNTLQGEAWPSRAAVWRPVGACGIDEMHDDGAGTIANKGSRPVH